MTQVTSPKIESLYIPGIGLANMTNHVLEINGVQIITLDGLNCGGVPTRTTPTLTPTTLRNIEQTFIEFQSEIESHENEAGFVPPLLQSSATPTVATSISQGTGRVQNNLNGVGGSVFMSMVDTKTWQGGSTTVTDMPPVSSSSTSSSLSTAPPHVMSAVATVHTNNHKRNIGGRRPNKENGISAEEEERRNLRRERNKLAAARCRKRRLDHTNELVEETEDLENKKQRLQDEIHQLNIQKEELQFLLEAHKPCCRLIRSHSPEDIKPFIIGQSDEVLTPTTEMLIRIAKNNSVSVPCMPETKVSGNTCKSRPTSLPVNNSFASRKTTGLEVPGVSITTPSAGISLNFDSLLETGMSFTTPVSSSASPLIPSCATQQRNLNVADLTSPDTVPAKLVSL